MWLEFIGMIMLIFGIILIILIHENDWKTVFLAFITAFGFVIAIGSSGVEGEPKTSIKTGDYLIVSYAKTVSEDKSMYQMVLKQNNKIKFYALPENMVIIDKSNGSPGTFEVIEKAGSKKAIMRP